jgi:hypothetical protein
VGALLTPGPTPAKTVAMRFPVQWTDVPHSPPPVEVAESESVPVQPQWLAFMNPHTSYPIAPVTYAADMAAPDAAEALAASPVLASSPSEPVSLAPPEPQGRMRVAAVGAVPMPHAKPPVPKAAKVDPRKGHVFTEKQIASIKQRLALTPDQEQYWPTIETALRDVKWKKKTGHQMAEVDTRTVDMERLKSIAVPLVLSFREDQKRELRSLAHLMGLNEVASAL